MRRPGRVLLPLAAALLLGGGATAEEAADVAAAEAALASADWRERVRGLGLLEALPPGKRARTAAESALADRDWSVQMRACATLAKWGGAESQDALLDLAMGGEIQRVRTAALEALEATPPEDLGARLLRRARVAREAEPKARAVEAAGRLATPDLVGKFREYALHKEVAVAAAGAQALGWCGRQEAAREDALRLLDDLLGSRGERRRFLAYAAALEALARIGTPEARRLLVREAVLQGDEDRYVAARVARSLRGAPAEEAAALLRDALAAAKKPEAARRVVRLAADVGARALRPEVEALLAARDAEVRAEAARTLGVFADGASTAPLEPLLADEEPEVRREGLSALARVLAPADLLARADRFLAEKDADLRWQYVVEVADRGDPAGVPVLARFLADGDWRVATAAAAALGTLGVAQDLPHLLPLTESRSWKVRAAAFEGMARLRAAAAIPVLTEGLLDKDPVVQGVCLANLQILTKERLGTRPDRWRAWWGKHGEGLVLVKRSRRSAQEIEEERRREAEELEKARYAHEKDDVTRAREARRRNVEILQKARILVVTGAWDHVEKVLGHLQIPHTLLRAQELKEAGINPNQVILVNCEGNLDKDSADRLRWFVNVGGYLMTTDWALTHTVQPCFPGYVVQFSGSSTGNDVVVVEEAEPGHPWTEGIFEGVPALMWWLEIQAFPIRVASPRRCEVIVDSAMMRQRYGSSPMAVAFRWGLGKVQHSISHFYLQEEGMQQTTDPRRRMVFAADHLGISLEQIRLLSEQGRWSGQLNEETMREIAPDYSMFRLIVNVVKEKSAWVENL